MNNTYLLTWDTPDTLKNSIRIGNKANFKIFNRNLMKSGDWICINVKKPALE